jgi:hypothetical protein
VCGRGAVLAIVLTVFIARAAAHCSAFNSGSSEWNDCVQRYLHLKK